MKTIVVSILFVILLGSWNGVNDFLSEQKKYARVRTAFDEKEKIIEQNLQKHGLQSDDFQILIVVYKDSDEFQILAKKKNETSYKTLINYAICARSGDLGPKRKQGDSQVPEGFYHISVFNPSSSFYLSLGVSYPNLADRRKSNAKDLGATFSSTDLA
jgi:murein L,D-transpeptidase YafK